MKLDAEKFKKKLQSKKRDMFHIETGDNLEVLKRLNPNQFHAMVTDPPAGIGFMGEDWDSNKGSRDNWIAWLATTMAEAMRVLKPGAYALVWAIPRTQHWTMMALENAGFEIRDVVYHLFGQGFPKSHDISKAIDKAAGVGRIIEGYRHRETGEVTDDPQSDGGGKDVKFGFKHAASGIRSVPITTPATPEAKKWDGWGTALKPAVEAWILVQKPISEGTIAENVLKHGVGGLNIDGTRIAADDLDALQKNWDRSQSKTMEGDREAYGKFGAIDLRDRAPTGRFPSNVILDEDAAKVLDEQSGPCKSGGASTGRGFQNDFVGGKVEEKGKLVAYAKDGGTGATRFFYTAKASKAEKNYGLEGIKQDHPTIKPVSLMKYLITLITPPGGTVLDPFMGSGTTGVAAIKNGFKFFGIDQEKRYTDIALKRLMAVYRVSPKDVKTIKTIDRGDADG